jgi:hypothetical protein
MNDRAKEPMRILSLGAGVQSSALALMMKHGLVEPVDHAIFADTQDEPRAVYRHLNWLEKQLPFPVHRVTAGKMSDDIMRDEIPEVRYLLPTFAADGGMGKRQCTRHYKLDVIKRKVRELGATRLNPATMVIGISWDEALRVNVSGVLYMRNSYPLVEMQQTRGHCLEWLASMGYPRPPKSACKHCPFHDNLGWQALEADEFAEVVSLDRFLRDKGGTEGKAQFLHRDRVPLDQADLSHISDVQTDMFGNECVGVCGV